MKQRQGIEGFDQRESFILKTNENIYDNFYVDVYDELMKSEKTSRDQMALVLRKVDIDKETSRILDLGSATGSMVNYLKSL